MAKQPEDIRRLLEGISEDDLKRFITYLYMTNQRAHLGILKQWKKVNGILTEKQRTSDPTPPVATGTSDDDIPF